MTFSFRPEFLIIGLSLAQILSACALQPKTSAAQHSEPPSSTPARVTMPGTELRQLKSSATGRNYDIYVRPPDGYVRGPGKNYPVLYVLDGQWDFKLLDSIYGGLYYDRFVPEMIIVGITYSGEDADYGALRAMDYTPVKDPFFPGSGDASKFLTFFKEELIPFIEAEYRADPSQRALMGSSFGGTFTLYAMFTEPTLFRGYVVGSPIVMFGNRDVYKQEAVYAREHQELPVRLFVGVGELEEIVQPVQEFIQILKERGYTGFEMETRIIEGERHAGNKPEIFNRGLRFIFQDE